MAKVTVLVGQGSRDWAHDLDDTLERWQLKYFPEDVKTANDLRKMLPEDFKTYIRKSSIEHLFELKTDLAAIITHIRGKLKGPGTNIQDPQEKGWFFSATRVKKNCGTFVAIIQDEIGIKARQRAADRKGVNDTVHKVFCDLVWDEDIIPHEQYKELFARARKVYASQHGFAADGANARR